MDAIETQELVTNVQRDTGAPIVNTVALSTAVEQHAVRMLVSVIYVDLVLGEMAVISLAPVTANVTDIQVTATIVILDIGVLNANRDAIRIVLNVI